MIISNQLMPTMISAPTSTRPRRAEWLGAVLLALVPTVFTVVFTALSMRFDYPQILRQPAGDVLLRFHQSEAGLLPLWWGMFVAALLFIPAVHLGAKAIGLRGATRKAALLYGTLAGVVQALGLARWIFLVPLLASAYAAPTATDTTRETARLLFESFHQFFGVGIGEWLGYLFTGIWTLLVSVTLWKGHSPLRGARIWGGAGVLFSLGILAGLLEVFGVPGVGMVNALAYMLWSLWLIALGVTLVVHHSRSQTTTRFTAQ